jgi:ribosomal protein S27E
MMKCPNCGRILIETNSDGTKKLRTRMLLFESDGTKAICPSCKAEVLVPVILMSPATGQGIKHVIMVDKSRCS